MTLNEFIELIDTSGDIMFECAGKSFTILCWYEGGPFIAEQVTEANPRVFPDGKALVDGYIIEGFPLSHWVEKIRITFCN